MIFLKSFFKQFCGFRIVNQEWSKWRFRQSPIKTKFVWFCFTFIFKPSGPKYGNLCKVSSMNINLGKYDNCLKSFKNLEKLSGWANKKLLVYDDNYSLCKAIVTLMYHFRLAKLLWNCMFQMMAKSREKSLFYLVVHST